MRNLLRLSRVQVISDNCSFTSTRRTNEHNRFTSLQVNVDHRSQTCRVDGRHVDLRENRLLRRCIVFNLPNIPLVLREIVEVIVRETLFRELNLCSSFPNRAEFLHIFLIILATSDGSTDRPETCENKERFECLLFFFFLHLLEFREMLNEQRV